MALALRRIFSGKINFPRGRCTRFQCAQNLPDPARPAGGRQAGLKILQRDFDIHQSHLVKTALKQTVGEIQFLNGNLREIDSGGIDSSGRILSYGGKRPEAKHPQHKNSKTLQEDWQTSFHH